MELKIVRTDLTLLSVKKLNLQLKMIDLSNNKIRSLPPELLLLSNLVSLNLKGNLLESLPKDKVKCDSFIQNDKQRSRISSVNSSNMSWANLTKLQDLNVNENKLRRLPDNIGSCISLKNLLINCNKLCEIPASFADLNNLESLNFEWFMYLDPPQQQY